MVPIRKNRNENKQEKFQQPLSMTTVYKRSAQKIVVTLMKYRI